MDWSSIRPINNSQKEGFEELICQLAYNERNIANKEQYIRKGKPDAGVECFWILNDNSEWAWQAKFFVSSLSNTQWTEIDKSVNTAIDKHPQLTKYFIALPVDRPDARLDGQKSMLDKWNEHVIKWEGWAVAKGMNVSFVYWGQSEIIERLGHKENEGKSEFWFNKTELTDEWFDERLDFSINALGQRYTPKINFKLPIAQLFDGLSKNGSFRNRLIIYFEEIYQRRRRTYHVFDVPILSSKTGQIDVQLKEIKKHFLAILELKTEDIDYESIAVLCTDVNSKLDECADILHKEKKEREKTKPTPEHATPPFSDSIHEIYSLQNTIRSFINFLYSSTCVLSNDPYVILLGEAGFGKSHLLADIAIKRRHDNQQTLLLLGQHFVTDESPWTQLLRNQLRISGNEYTFLGALKSKAQASGSRILLIIDALNEGTGKKIWPDQLKHFFLLVKKYKWLSLVVSIRSTYENLIADESIYEEKIALKIIHPGFSELEYEAADYFFDNYKIRKPRIPFLHPEFRSPLFLKLFCDGLQKKRLNEIPEGYEGITTIIGFFLDAINERLAIKFGYKSSINLVKKSVETLASIISDSSEKNVSYESATYFFNDLKDLRILHDKTGFFDALIEEGVLSKNLFWTDDNTYKEGVYFSYERFLDHLTASFFIRDFGNNPISAFKKRGKLNKFFKDGIVNYDNVGLAEALSIQIPEKYEIEFFELVPLTSATFAVAKAFVGSIPWRKKESFWPKDISRNWIERQLHYIKNKVVGWPNESKEKRIMTYIRTVVTQNTTLENSFLESILSVSSVPGHVFNAYFFHSKMIRVAMADRDAYLLIWLNENYGSSSIVDRLIDWGWKDEKREYLDDESVFLTSIILSWFLISSNREIRDSATKSLICLLQYREHLIIRLLKEFELVNDPYVYERLYGVAYGCTLRADNRDFLPSLSEYIYHTIFDQDQVYPHILLRSYAKGVLDFAILNNVAFKCDKALISPPYRSQEITDFPTNEEIDAEYRLSDKDSRFYYYQNKILESMTTEHGRGKWTMYGDFGRYTFQSAIDQWHVNPSAYSNYAIKRIFEMGYDVKKHAGFDYNQKSGRSDGHNERIGKKYQWIAMHEILARVADHNVMYENSWSDEEITFEGPWHPNVRDIDLTLIIKSTKRLEFDETIPQNSWYMTVSYENWNFSNKDWLLEKSDLPDISKMIQITDPKGVEWLCLEIMPEWSEETPIGEDRWDVSHKRLYLQVRSYLVKDESYNAFLKWGVNADFTGGWMPTATQRSEVFSREYYRTEAYSFFQKPYYGGELFHEIYDNNTHKLVAEVHIPVDDFQWQKEGDGSQEKFVSFYKPSELLFDGLKMKFAHSEGEFINSLGEKICFDPSVSDVCLTCLLIRKDDLLSFLKDSNMKICWTVVGEKQILGSHRSEDIPNAAHYFNGFYSITDDGKLQGNTKSRIKKFGS